MNTLPNYLYFSPKKAISSSMQKPESSNQTVPIEDFDCSDVRKKDLNNFKEARQKKISNVLEWIIKDKKEKHIFFYIFKNIIFPQLLAFFFIFILILIKKIMELNCFEQNGFTNIYFLFRDALFSVFFYNMWVALCLFDEDFHKIPKILMFFGTLFIIVLIRHYKTSVLVIGEMIFDENIFSALFQVVFYLCVQIYQKDFGRKQIVRLFLVFVYFIIVAFDDMIVRQYLIKFVYIKLENFENGKIIFQFFLFIFYQINGKIFLGILNRFRSKIPKNCFLFSIKYYIINVLSSCTLLPIVYSNEKQIQFFAIFNFSAQLISLYLQENIFLHYISIIVDFLKDKMTKHSKNKKNNNTEINSMIAGLTNEAMHAIIFASMNIIIFNRNFEGWLYENLRIQGTCFTNFDNLIIFIPQNLCILCAINFFYFFYLIMQMKDDGKIKFLWKLEEYNFFVRIYYIVLIQVYADRNFQFYLSLYLIQA